MFKLFQSDPIKKLGKKHKALLAEAHRLSHTDRKASDAKMAEAESVAQEMDRLRAQQAGS